MTDFSSLFKGWTTMAYGQQPGYGHRGRAQGPPAGGRQPSAPHGRPAYDPPQQYPQPQQYPSPPQYAPPAQSPPPAQYAPPGRYAPPYAEHPRAARRRPEAPTDGSVTEEDERWAVPAYIGMFVAGFFAPAIVLAVRGRSSPFARFHATQALNLFVPMFLFTFLALLLTYLNGPAWLLLVLAVLAVDCFCVIKAAIGANRCEWYRLPALVAWRIFH